MNINETAQTIHMNAKVKGFWDEDKIIETMLVHDDMFSAEDRETVRNAFKAQKFALMTTEIAEAIESARNNKHAHLRYFEERMIEVEQSYSEGTLQSQKDMDFLRTFKHSIKDSVEDELADTMIRIMDYAARYNIDLERHIELKMRYNSLRPHKHGKKY